MPQFLSIANVLEIETFLSDFAIVMTVEPGRVTIAVKH